MPQIDNTVMLTQALEITGAATKLLEKLDAAVKDTPEKVRTYEMIKTVVEAQSLAIRRLVEDRVAINDALNELADKHHI